MKLEAWLPVLVAAVVGGAAVFLMRAEPVRIAAPASDDTATAIHELRAEVARLREQLLTNPALLSGGASTQPRNGRTSGDSGPALLEGAPTPIVERRTPPAVVAARRDRPRDPPPRSTAVVQRLQKLLADNNEQRNVNSRRWLLVGEDVLLLTFGVPDAINSFNSGEHWVYRFDDDQITFNLRRGRVMRVD